MIINKVFGALTKIYKLLTLKLNKMKKTKREIFEEAEEILRKQKTIHTAPKKEEPKKEDKPKDTKQDSKKEPTLDQLVDEAAKDVLKKDDSKKDVSTLLIEEATKRELSKENTTTSLYGEKPKDLTQEAQSIDVYARAGNSGGGYSSLINSDPYHMSGGGYGVSVGGYGPGNDAYDVGGAYDHGSGDQGAYESAGSGASRAIDVGGLQRKVNEDAMAGSRITPAKKAHEAHIGGPVVSGCSYCAKAMNR